MNDHSDSSPPTPPAGSETRPRRQTYATPTLRRYGAIRSLTSGGFGSMQEGMMGTSAKKFP